MQQRSALSHQEFTCLRRCAAFQSSWAVRASCNRDLLPVVNITSREEQRCMNSDSLRLRRFSGRRLSRLAIENLEPRVCLAVTATFQAGILTVVGDAGPNVVELFQPADRVVQVTGDGETWTFSGVDEVLVNTGEGNDQATSSKPKEIVVVGSKIKFEMGAGNDLVRIDDGGTADRPTLFNASLVAAVDLGTARIGSRSMSSIMTMLNLMCWLRTAAMESH